MTVEAATTPPAGDCGPLYALYAAARSGDEERVREAWGALASHGVPHDGDLDPDVDGATDRLEAAVEAGDLDAVQRLAGDLAFVDEETPTLDGPVARALGAVLHAFGYVASFVLFFRASSPEAVVRRLRWAYRRVGVRLQDVESADGVERTVFRCPYRTLGAARYGERRVCHDVLDRVDDGYVTFLARHRGLAYDRPRRCAGSPCCHSEVGER